MSMFLQINIVLSVLKLIVKDLNTLHMPIKILVFKYFSKYQTIRDLGCRSGL